MASNPATALMQAAHWKKLGGVHPHLVAVAHRAAELMPPGLTFKITCGLRSVSEQRRLVKIGASRTMKSRHLTGHALDIAVFIAGKLTWAFEPYRIASVAFKQAARELSTPVEWGGDWASFRDGPHFQLPWTYLADANAALPAAKAARVPVSVRIQPMEAEFNLTVGSQGARVRALQETLTAIGYATAADGYFGPKTREHVFMAQLKVSRPQTGIATPQDIAALEKLARSKAKVA